MTAIFSLIIMILQLYFYIIIASAILSWLMFFNVINTQNKFVYLVSDFVHRVTEPALAPIRRFMPNLGGLDISPIILLFAIIFLQNLIQYDIAPLFIRS